MNERASDAQQTNFSLWLDFFRWISALSVIITHIDINLLVRIDQIPKDQPKIIAYIYAFFCGFDHYGVMLFFVISGFLVGGPLFHQIARGRWNVRRYVEKRLTRMLIVIWPALALIFLIDVATIAFGGLHYNIITDQIILDMKLYPLACNAMFLETGACRQYGGDGPLWSLYCEFWYYWVWLFLAFGLFAPLKLRLRVGLLSIAGLMLVVLTLVQERDLPSFAPYMVIWLLGVAAAAWRRSPPCSVKVATALFVGILLVVRVSVRLSFYQTHPVSDYFIDLLTSLAFANLLISMRAAPKLGGPPGANINKFLASFSFSLYCIHLPIIRLYATILVHYFGTGWAMKNTGLLTWGIVIGAIGVSFVCGFLFSLVTEANTERVRSWLGQIWAARQDDSNKIYRNS